MKLKDKIWFTALNLTEDMFSACPQDADPLIWGLEEGVIKEEDYLNWARNHYQIPQIKSEFFSFAIDKTLSEKYASLTEWNPTFYPIYEWEDVLYIACLEPQEIGHGKSVCHVLSSYKAMTDLWFSIKAPEATGSDVNPLADLEVPEAPQPVSTKETTEDPQDSPNAEELPAFEVPPLAEAQEQKVEPEVAPPPPSESNASTLTGLDFSGMSLNDSATSVHQVEQEAAPAPPQEPAEPAQPEPPAFADLGFGDLKPAVPKTPGTPEPPVFAEAPPVEEIDDDKTPPPIVDGAPPPPMDFAAPPPPLEGPATPPPPMDLNLEPPSPANIPPAPPAAPQMSPTDTAIAAAYIPEENLVNDQMIATAPELESCSTLDDAVLYMFKSVKRDFSKLMWLPNSKGKGFIPGKAHGPWAAAPATWTTPVNIDEPNIFRIAYNSKLPFHGPISMNDINEQYFAIWDQSRAPEHITIFPVCTATKECLGFVVGAGKGEDFDQKNTLKKFTSIVELTAKQLKLNQAKAS